MRKTIFSFLSSLKLTITLLIIIAGASILGTVIPQQYGAEGAIHNLSPGLIQLFEALQLFDLYHSTWFIMLMSLLSVNLIACSLKRFPTSWKLFRKTPSLDADRPFQNLPPERVITIEGKPHGLIDTVESLLLKRYKRVRKKELERGAVFYGEKGIYSRFGVYITHASVLVVIAGAIVGSLLGFDAFVNLAEGESTNTVYVTRQKGIKQLDFTLRCDTFSVSFYDNGMPKEYRSQLSFLKDNTVIHQGPLLVNHPITFDGIRFYQASYGTIPGDEVYLSIRKGNGEAVAKTVKLNEPFLLDDEDTRSEVVRIEENFMSMGPAVLLEIKSPGNSTRFWVFKYIERIVERFPGILEKFPKFNPGLVKPYSFSLDRIESRYYTGLQVSRDPGVYTVAVGGFFIIIGFLITFFGSHRRFWIKVEEQRGRSRISIAATSTKDPVGLDREVQHLIKHLSLVRD
ncbi:MAG: cytochrome c biogenesis protein ResB [Deltaproteobacteria bacterium]|nr:cytochrome c biogenesis protein ResB [Deltaproteobacteria bacterium]